MNRICQTWPGLIAGALLFCGPLPAAESLSLNPPSLRAQVVTARNPQATVALKPTPEIVDAMVNQAITNLTGKPTVAEIDSEASCVWLLVRYQ